MQLRPYQQEAVNATIAALKKESRVLVVAPTGSGKSIIIKEIAERFARKHPSERVLVLCHQKEILVQNESKISREFKTSFYCASLGKKDLSGQIVFASRDSFVKVAERFSLILLDEAHLVGKGEKTRYQKIFKNVQPRYIIGLTGTPWRLDNGLIFGGKKEFSVCSYAVSMELLMGEGYLNKYTLSFDPKKLINTDGIRVKSTGDFDERWLEEVSASDEIVKKSILDWEEKALLRVTSLFFCCSIAHAEKVYQYLCERKWTSAIITGKTPALERERILGEAKKGTYKAIVNVAVLTTGIDLPIVDCIVMLRATMSASLFIQCIGRGLRTYTGKKPTLILDYTDNLDRFGSIENPMVYFGKPKADQDKIREALLAVGIDSMDTGQGEMTKKKCKECKTESHIASKACPCCGNLFISHGIEAVGLDDFMPLDKVETVRARTKNGDTCIIVTYHSDGKVFREWLFPDARDFRKYVYLKKIKLIENAKSIKVKIGKNPDYPNIVLSAQEVER